MKVLLMPKNPGLNIKNTVDCTLHAIEKYLQTIFKKCYLFLISCY